MAYCGNCGKKVADEQKFCSSCGAALNENASQKDNKANFIAKQSIIYNIVHALKAPRMSGGVFALFVVMTIVITMIVRLPFFIGFSEFTRTGMAPSLLPLYVGSLFFLAAYVFLGRKRLADMGINASNIKKATIGFSIIVLGIYFFQLTNYGEILNMGTAMSGRSMDGREYDSLMLIIRDKSSTIQTFGRIMWIVVLGPLLLAIKPSQEEDNEYGSKPMTFKQMLNLK